MSIVLIGFQESQARWLIEESSAIRIRIFPPCEISCTLFQLSFHWRQFAQIVLSGLPISPLCTLLLQCGKEIYFWSPSWSVCWCTVPTRTWKVGWVLIDIFFFFFFFFANNNFLCYWFGFWINERVYFDNLLKVDGDLVGKSGADLLIKGDPWKMLTLLERLMVANSGKLHDGQRAGHKSVANKNKTSKRNAELIHSILGIPRMMKMMGKK